MEILSDITYKILSNRIKIMDSYKITDRAKMKEILYAIQHKHPELDFNRSYNDLVCEWVAHNRMYKWGIKPEKTKDVDLEFEESKCKIFIYKILGI